MKTIINIKTYEPEWQEMLKEDKDCFAFINEADDLRNMKYADGLKSTSNEEIKTVVLEDVLVLGFLSIMCFLKSILFQKI